MCHESFKSKKQLTLHRGTTDHKETVKKCFKVDLEETKVDKGVNLTVSLLSPNTVKFRD